MKIRQLICIALSVAFGLPTFAQTAREVNYAGTDLTMWGTNKAETYDLAVYLNDAKLVGAEIVGVDLPVVVASGTDNWSVWLSSQLSLENKQNVADIATVAATPTNGRISVTFDTPYTIPAQGVYVGYSFDVDTLSTATRQPVSAGVSNNSAAFNVHTSRTYLKWREAGNGLALNLTVRVRGNFGSDAVELVALPECGEAIGADIHPVAKVQNVGVNEVDSIKYTWTFNGATQSGVKTFVPALSSQTGELIDLPFTLPTTDAAGAYPCTLEITEVNGRTNATDSAAITTDMYVYPYRPVHQPLVEDYTGTWCGWCPRGTIAFEGMKSEFGDEFIVVAYHIDDILTITPNPYVANSGVPGAYIDRGGFNDPYFGSLSDSAAAQTVTYKEGFKLDWEAERAKTAVADLEISAQWNDDKTFVHIGSRVKFMRPFADAGFRMMYILVNSELTGSGRGWFQKNYFSGNDAYRSTDLEPLVDQPIQIKDIAFQDVAILAPYTFGKEGSLPTEIPYLKELYVSEEFSLDQVTTTPPDEYAKVSIDLVQDKSKLRAVAAIYDARTGRVVNARMASIIDSASIADLTADDDAAEQWYTLQGVRVDAANLAPGIYIRRVGSKVTKTIIR